MSLPSQGARTSTGSPRAYSYKRRRRGGLPVPAPVVIGLAVVGVVVLVIVSSRVLGGGGPSESDAAVAGGEADGDLDIVEPVEPPPLIVDQSGGGTGRRSAGNGDRLMMPIEEDEIADPLAGGGLLGSARTVDSRDAGSGSVLPEPIGSETDDSGSESASSGREEPPAGFDDGSSRLGVIAMADERLAANDPLGARRILSDALPRPGVSGGLTPLERAVVRERLAELNEDLVFGPTITPGDPIATAYRVAPGDALSRIARRAQLGTNWKLIQRVNGLANANRIRVGQQLKLVRGPFHAVVHKSDYRVDIFHGVPEAPSEWVYIRSFDAGLGAADSTPVGSFRVREGGKDVNPPWTNPRDPSERYSRDDPANPIGEFWIGIEGIGDDAVHVGYGLHGTIEPESIGTQASMGCVRMRADDIGLVYELLQEGESRVVIRP